MKRYWTSNCKTSKIYIGVKPWLINSQQLVLLPAARTAVHQPGHVQHTPCNKQHNIRTQSNFRLIRRYHRKGVASAPGFLFWISLTALEKLCEANRNLSSRLRKVNKGGDQDAKERAHQWNLALIHWSCCSQVGVQRPAHITFMWSQEAPEVGTYNLAQTLAFLPLDYQAKVWTTRYMYT